MATASADQRNRALSFLLPGFLCAGVLLVYANSLSVPFLLDDFATIPDNASIRKLSSLRDVLFPPPNVYSAGRPVLNLSFALNYAIGGAAVRGYHVLNILIHTAAALTLFGLVRRTLELPRFRARFAGAATLLAFAISALWAWHPLQSVSVTYLSQRAESLVGLFYLLTLYCFVRSIESERPLWRAAAILACLSGMAAKEVMVTAPVVVFLFDAVCVAGSFREAWSRRWRIHLALCATWLLLGSLMIGSELSRRAVGGEHGLTWFNYARLECIAVATYLRLAVWPSPLVFDYGADLPLPALHALIIPGLVLGALIAFSLYQLIKCRVSGFLGSVIFIFLAPTSSIVPIAGQPIAENRAYLPLVPVVTALVASSYLVGLRKAHWWWITGAAGLALSCHARNATFQTPAAIWRDTVAKQPVNSRAWVFFSEALKAEGRLDAAIQVLLAAIRQRPDHVQLRNNLAVAYYSAGKLQEAVDQFQAAIRQKPDFSEGYYNFGAMLFRIDQIPVALECFQHHLRLTPRSVEGQNYVGLCLLRLGRPAEAVPYFQAAVQLDPTHKDARSNLDAAQRAAKP